MSLVFLKLFGIVFEDFIVKVLVVHLILGIGLGCYIVCCKILKSSEGSDVVVILSVLCNKPPPTTTTNPNHDKHQT